MAAEEKDDEEQEDVLALMQTVDVPDLSRGDGGEAGAETDVEPAPGEMEDGRSGGRTAAEIASELPGVAAGEAAEALPPEGPVWTVRAVEPEMEVARKLAAERLERGAEALEAAREAGTPAGWAVEEAVREPAEAAFEGAWRAAEKQAGLEGLYRQTVRAAQPAAPALPPERAGRTVRAQEPGSAASLAVDELDRAVRRDSRRYDGGMSIF